MIAGDIPRPWFITPGLGENLSTRVFHYSTLFCNKPVDGLISHRCFGLNLRIGGSPTVVL